MRSLTHSVAMGPEVLTSFDATLDARSPSEFAEDHLPGARSLPVLGDAERAYIGTIFKQHSRFEAKRQGAVLVSRNIARHLESSLAAMPRNWRPLVYCWRGGKRSASFAHVLREVGWDARTLEGGYRAYRRWIVEQLAQVPGRYRFRVVHGATGSGKSRLLRALARAGAQVLDLEALAAHRGSVLGELPGQPQPPQKLFESRLYAALALLSPAQAVYVEGESRKIGQLQVPEALITAMRASECVQLEAAPEARVALLMDEYRHFFADTGALRAQLDCLVPLHGHERVASWKSLVEQGEFEVLVARLLAEHYDPAYRRSAERNFVRLPEAPVLRVPSADDAAFAGIAQALAA